MNPKFDNILEQIDGLHPILEKDDFFNAFSKKFKSEINKLAIELINGVDISSLRREIEDIADIELWNKSLSVEIDESKLAKAIENNLK